jgi:hypothetical protein
MQQHAIDGTTWAQWDAANAVDDDTRLAVLREFIFATAKAFANRYPVTPAWVNKKLGGLGVADRITAEQSYGIEVAVTGVLTIGVYAHNRAEALEKFEDRVKGLAGGGFHVTNVISTSLPVFTDASPQDQVGAVDDDAPQTVDETLAALREVILLGHVAGPKYCADEADEVLAAYGLDPIPAKVEFVVERPMTGTMRTTVTAYDVETAQRVAGWRWENERAGFELTQATPVDDVRVTHAS